MEIYGLDPVVASILITGLGVSISVLLGWLKGTNPFNVKNAVASTIIAFVVSVQMVISQVSNISADVSDLELGAAIFAWIAIVAGIDSLSKSAAKAAVKVMKKK